MGRIWTHGTWIVKPGHEDAFIAAWLTLAREGAGELGEIEPPTLLRDRECPNAFVSFGPWQNLEEIEKFRKSAAFGRAMAAMREVLEGFEPRTLDEIR